MIIPSVHRPAVEKASWTRTLQKGAHFPNHLEFSRGHRGCSASANEIIAMALKTPQTPGFCN